MKILTVEYRRLKNLGNYENETIGAVAQVEAGETPEQALEKLKVFVSEQFLGKVLQSMLPEVDDDNADGDNVVELTCLSCGFREINLDTCPKCGTPLIPF